MVHSDTGTVPVPTLKAQNITLTNTVKLSIHRQISVLTLCDQRFLHCFQSIQVSAAMLLKKYISTTYGGPANMSEGHLINAANESCAYF